MVRRRFKRCLKDPRLDLLARQYAADQDQKHLPELYELCLAELKAWRRILIFTHRKLATDSVLEIAILDFFDRIADNRMSLYDPTEVLHICAYQNNRRKHMPAEQLSPAQRKTTSLSASQIEALLTDALVSQNPDIQMAVLFGLRHKDGVGSIGQLLSEADALHTKVLLFQIEKKLGLPDFEILPPAEASSMALGLRLATLEAVDPIVAVLALAIGDWNEILRILRFADGQTIQFPKVAKVTAALREVANLEKVLAGDGKLSQKEHEALLFATEDSIIFQEYVTRALDATFCQYEKLYTKLLSGLTSANTEEILMIYQRLSKDANDQIATIQRLAISLAERRSEF